MTANRRHPVQRVLLLVAITLLTTAAATVIAGASTARAGTYLMQQCQDDPVSRAVSGTWGIFGGLHGSDGTAARFFNNCGAGGAFGLSHVGDMTYNTVGGLDLPVPASRPNITIAHVHINVSTPKEYFNICDDGGCQYSWLWLVGSGQKVFDQEMTGWSQTVDADMPPSRDLNAAIYCSFGNGPQNCYWESDPVISIDQLTLTLQESAPPTAQATGGTLLNGGTMSGTQTLSYSASDGDSGVRDVAVQLGSTTVGSDSYAGSCTNNDWNACPLRQDRAEMSIDTARVADGTYPLKFVVTDAAGNTATVDSGRSVTVNNARANGTGAGKKSSSVQLVLGQGQTGALRTRYGRKLVITGRAVDSDGHPIANAPIDVSSQVAQAGQNFADLGETRTDANGAFAFSVPPGPNRTLRFFYTSPVRAGEQARAQTDVVVQSRATASLKASAHKVAGGRRVTFRGQLSGGPFPSAGVPVFFRGKVGKHTRKFGDTQSDAQGRFHLTYKFGPVGPRKATYPIWVRIGADEADYPYLPGLSNRVRITVVR
jgi:protocatechuate 3,4-dioxygenase beta subunit